ncbi:hypothetical protein F4819DRAFT_116995 [Hypoxylon fuscum]|nr:hypothetical protein F4819DRAFT_116995 [Hypoxylon fuscum]
MTRSFNRVRSSTKSLLGTNYEETVDGSIAPLVPPQDVNGYTDDRLKEGLAFVNNVLRNPKRRISPIGSHCLEMYKASVKDVLDKDYEDDQEKDLLVKNIAVYENDIYVKDFLRGPNNELESDIVLRLGELRRFEFAARYGDYMQRVCENVKTTARAEKTEHFEELQGWGRYWTDISGQLSQEDTDYKRFRAGIAGIKPGQVKISLAIHNACSAMGLNFDITRHSITMHVNPNKLVHLSIQRMIEQEDWHSLKEVLVRDLHDLPLVAPHHLRPSIPVVQSIIESILDEKFDRDPDEPYAVIRWVVKKEVFDRSKDSEDSKEKRQVALIQERERIQKAAEKRFKILVEEHSMAHLPAAAVNVEMPPTGDVNHSTTRRASEEPSERQRSIKRQKVAWQKLVNIQAEAHKHYKAYISEYGGEAPIEPGFWLENDNFEQKQNLGPRWTYLGL